ncbi:hypothetical protein [Rhodohalobacter sp. 614A]|uniref:hypothetical protein n=1 Tax=Rhodohalobacter sp. 614A TaxID=2908649 RepID=UPI001F467971|nr:hypothetical protein [Rhodohalobacter sp. 614A]
MISSTTFWRTVICGLIATFTMTMVSFLQGGIGLPAIDIGHILKQTFNHVHGDEVYSLIWGNAAFNVGGVLMALFWVAFLQNRIPGNWFIQGIIYGIIISVVTGLVISPLFAKAAGESFGIFYTDTWIPGLILIGGIVMHISYGITLTLCLKVAGVNGVDQ